ncbi:MAG TPA: hypothetical protein VGI87_04535 [Solirubrobacteraceae bacterium]|jgi:hypothetical protein
MARRILITVGLVGASTLALALSSVARMSVRSPVSAPTCAAREAVGIPHTSWPPARRHVAPPGASALRLCRYLGGNTRDPGALARTVLVIQQQQIRQIAHELNSLRRLPAHALCPKDDGSMITILARYPQHRRLAIAVILTGCTQVTNGNRDYVASEHLLNQLETLTGYHRS